VKYILFIVTFLFLSSALFGQDTLFFRSGKIIPVYIKTINTKYIICKSYKNPYGLSHYIRKDSVSMVHFGDIPGKSLVFPAPVNISKPPPIVVNKPLNNAHNELRNAIIFQVLAPAALFTGNYMHSYHVTTTTSASYSNSNNAGTVTSTSYPYKSTSYLFYAGGCVMEIIAIADFIKADKSFKKTSQGISFSALDHGIGITFNF